MEYFQVLLWSSIATFLSLIGGLVLVKNSRLRAQAVKFGLPLGAGALLAAAFVGVLPEAVEMSDINKVGMFALGGFLLFFILERMLGWFHHHEHHDLHEHPVNNQNITHQWLVIIGDTIHNAIDGIAIGAAFLINPAAGIGTALAVAAHEFPQEIGDFGILLAKGMKPHRVVFVNVFSGLATVVMALATFTLGSSMLINPAPLLAAAAGFFIYVAASDIIPDIHEQPRQEADRQALLLLIGVAVIATVIQVVPH